MYVYLPVECQTEKNDTSSVLIGAEGKDLINSHAINQHDRVVLCKFASVPTGKAKQRPVNTEQPISLIDDVSYKSDSPVLPSPNSGAETVQECTAEVRETEQEEGCGERTLEIKVSLKKEEEYP